VRWAREQGCARVYWLTQSGKETARRLYDQVAGQQRIHSVHDPALALALVQTPTVSWLAQYLHLVASAGTSSDLHSGQVFVGTGSPNTVVPLRFM
jgi:hypothetical protein